LVLTWYNTNFESSDIEEQVTVLDEALKIEKLRPWDNFLQVSASCFHSYFFGDEPGVVTKEDVQKYAQNLEAENKRRESFFLPGGSGPFPVNEVKSLLTSEDHWVYCKFWAQQETLVLYMTELRHCLIEYWFYKMDKLGSKKADSFWVSLSSITPYVDSILMEFGTKIESLYKPFEYPVSVQWDPFESRMWSNVNLWGPLKNFDEYTKFDLDAILLKLQKLNHLSRFKRELLNNQKVLSHSKADLEKIFRSGSAFKLDKIINSELLKSSDLPDSIQLPSISNLVVGRAAIPPVGTDSFLSAYFPAYVKVLEDYKIDKVEGVKTLRNILASQKGNAKQKVQTLGVEISSKSIFYFLPALTFCFYFFVAILMWKLYNGLKNNWSFSEITDETKLKKEVTNSPSFIVITPKWVSFLLLLVPGVSIIATLLIQFIIQEKTGLIMNGIYIWAAIAIYLLMLCSITILRKKLESCIAESA
jgi:hypothetical protein